MHAGVVVVEEEGGDVVVVVVDVVVSDVVFPNRSSIKSSHASTICVGGASPSPKTQSWTWIPCSFNGTGE